MTARPDARSIPLGRTASGARVWCLFGPPCPTCQADTAPQSRIPAAEPEPEPEAEL